jgi:gluconolactonase
MKKYARAVCLSAALLAAPAWAVDDFVIHNAATWEQIVPRESRVRLLASGFRFLEGPVWVGRDGGYLLFSDIPADEIKRWSQDGAVSTFRSPSGKVNGNTLDREGRLVSCEEGARRVIRAENDGSIKVLADSYGGKKLNSPNDVVVKSDGTIWFTDPPYGIKPGQQELPGNYVFRIEPGSGRLTAVVTDCDHPNGLCFSPSEDRLYVADSGKPRDIRVYSLRRDNSVYNGRLFCAIDNGSPDGIRCDSEGRVYSSAGDGVQIFSADGVLIGKIITPTPAGGKSPEAPSNLCFGGPDGRTLFITARKSLYAIPVLSRGAR